MSYIASLKKVDVINKKPVLSFDAMVKVVSEMNGFVCFESEFCAETGTALCRVILADGQSYEGIMKLSDIDDKSFFATADEDIRKRFVMQGAQRRACKKALSDVATGLGIAYELSTEPPEGVTV